MNFCYGFFNVILNINDIISSKFNYFVNKNKIRFCICKNYKIVKMKLWWKGNIFLLKK